MRIARLVSHSLPVFLMSVFGGCYVAGGVGVASPLSDTSVVTGAIGSIDSGFVVDLEGAQLMAGGKLGFWPTGQEQHSFLIGGAVEFMVEQKPVGRPLRSWSGSKYGRCRALQRKACCYIVGIFRA